MFWVGVFFCASIHAAPEAIKIIEIILDPDSRTD
jgi:hypothetical protein